MEKTVKKTKQVRAGSLLIGGDAPVSIQSMTNIPVENVQGNIDQINSLKNAGAELVRLAIRTVDEVKYLKDIIKNSEIPLCADIHFDYRIAVESIKAGIHKVRINPGNIGSKDRVREVVKAAKEYGVPIRIGVNGGSVNKKRFAEVNPESLVESALEHVMILEDNDFNDIVVSIKSSELFHNIEANKLFSEKRDYPLHIGLTEAGYGLSCIVQSSVLLGHLLLLGIGNTVRVSMTGDPVEEIAVAKKILQSTGMAVSPLKIISCPTCGRTSEDIDLLSLASKIETSAMNRYKSQLLSLNKTVEIAVMGCEVNGPGEASHADIGLAGGKDGSLILFAKGKKIKKIDSSMAVKEILSELEKIFNEGEE